MTTIIQVKVDFNTEKGNLKMILFILLIQSSLANFETFVNFGEKSEIACDWTHLNTIVFEEKDCVPNFNDKCLTTPNGAQSLCVEKISDLPYYYKSHYEYTTPSCDGIVNGIYVQKIYDCNSMKGSSYRNSCNETHYDLETWDIEDCIGVPNITSYLRGKCIASERKPWSSIIDCSFKK